MRFSLMQTWHGLSPAGRARAWLGVAAIILVLIILFCGKPWDVVFEEGRALKPEDYMRLWFWPAAVGNLFLVGILAWAAPFWTRPVRSLPEARPSKRPRWFWPLVLGAAVLLAAMGSLRLGQSLWHDEAHRVKWNMVGTYKERDGGRQEFRKVDWVDTLFYSEMPNHALQNVASKAFHDVWSVFAPRDFPIHEPPLRLPVLIAALGGLVALALLLANLGFPAAGALAAWLLALHPWYLRYASEARGYGFVMALLPVLLLAFFRAAASGKARWWVAFALVQFAIVYSLVSALYIPLVLNLLALPFLAVQVRKGLDLARTTTHWLVATTLSAGLFLQLFLPNVPQMLHFLTSEKGRGAGNVMGLNWLHNFFSNLAAGSPWTHSFTPASPYMEMLPRWHEAPWLHLVAFLLLGVGAVAGVLRAFRSGVAASLAMVVFLLPPAISYGVTRLTGGFQFDWYLVYMVPGFVAALALALAWLPERASSRGMRTAGWILAVTALALYAAWASPQRAFLLWHPVQPYREAVLLARPTLDPAAPGQGKVLTAYFHAGPLAYDPRVQRCRSAAEIVALAHQADAQNKRLYFILGYLDTTRAEHPNKYRLMEESGLFEEVALLRGTVPSLSMHVFRYVPGSAAGFDPSGYEDAD